MGGSEFIGSMGQAMIFMCTLAALGIFVPLWLCYASHCFLTVLSESSVGDPEVRWPDEIVTDWFSKALYCFGMLVFWATAVGMVLAPLYVVNPWVFAGAAAVVVWFAYPIGVLCGMAAHSTFAIVHLPLLAQLGRRAGAVLFVGLATLPLGAGVAAVLAAVLLNSGWWIILAAVALPVAVLLYGRSWGRLAWMVLNVKPRRRPEHKRGGRLVGATFPRVTVEV